MTLVPIIYTSLLIFSAVLFIVIAISYISFKAKTRKTLRPAERLRQESIIRNNNYITAVPRVQLAAAPTIMVLPTIANNPVQKEVKVPAAEMSSKRKNYNPDNRNSRKAEQIRREALQKESREINSRSRSSYASMKTRLEVMNNTNPVQPVVNPNRERVRHLKRTNDLSDYSLLNFYFDGKDNQLSTAKTVQFRQAL